MMLSIEQRRRMKSSLSTGDILAAQEFWVAMHDNMTTMVQPWRSSPARKGADAGSSPPRWGMDDLLRLPAKVISGVNEPMMRYSLPRKHTLRQGAAAHLGGGRPAAVSPSIHGDGGRMAIERRVADGCAPSPLELGTLPAPVLASELGWTVPSLSAPSLGAEDSRVRSASASALSSAGPGGSGASPLLLLDRQRSAQQPGERQAQREGRAPRSLSSSWTEGVREPSHRTRHRAAASASASALSGRPGSALGSAQPRGGRGGASLARPALPSASPSRRELATGRALPQPQPRFEPQSLAPALARVRLSPAELPEAVRAPGLPLLLRGQAQGQEGSHADGSHAESGMEAEGSALSAEPQQQQAEEAHAAEAALQALRVQQKLFTAQQRYLHAEAARELGAQLASAHGQRQRQQQAGRQAAEVEAAGEAHRQDRQRLAQHWAQRLQRFDRQALAMEAELAQRHAHEHRLLLQRLAGPPAPRPSSTRALLERRAAEARLAGSSRYGDAAQLRAEVLALEGAEQAVTLAEQARHAALATRQLAAQQGAEDAALAQRVRSGRTEHTLQRQAEAQVLAQRFQNVLLELETQQRTEQRGLERAGRLLRGGGEAGVQLLRAPAAPVVEEPPAPRQGPPAPGPGPGLATSTITVSPSQISAA